MKINKFTVLILAFVMIAFSSCSGGVAPIKGDKDDLKVVANVLEKPICLEEVEYLTFNYKLEMENKYGEGIWDTAEGSELYRAELESKVEAAMLKNPILLSFYEEYNIDIDDKDTKNSVQEYINSVVDEIGGGEEYKKQLKENGISDHHLRYLLALEMSREELRQKFLETGLIDDSDDTARDFIESDEVIRTLHVYIGNDAGDDIDENRKLAEKVVSLLEEGEPITRMIGRYSEDFYMTTTDGYYFMRGEYEEAYENAAFALGVDEYSGVVEGENGFYVIMRLPKESEYIEKNFADLKDRYIYVLFENIINERLATAELVYTDYGKNIDILNLE